MKLKENIDMETFMAAVKHCEGDVFFHTDEGDILNIKSMLSQYVLMSVYKPGLLKQAQVVCTRDEDYKVLEDCLTA